MAVETTYNNEANITRLNYVDNFGSRAKSMEVVIAGSHASDPHEKSTILTFNIGNMGLTDGQKAQAAKAFSDATIKSYSTGNHTITLDMGENCTLVSVYNEIQKLSKCQGIGSDCAQEIAHAYSQTPAYKVAFAWEAVNLLITTSWLVPKIEGEIARVPIDGTTGEFRIPNPVTPLISALNEGSDGKKRGRE